jgi:hypothetical protein
MPSFPSWWIRSSSRNYQKILGRRYDDLVKSLKTVTPAEAGVQNYLNLLDSRFRENDKIGEIKTFYETIRFRAREIWKKELSTQYY